MHRQKIKPVRNHQQNANRQNHFSKFKTNPIRLVAMPKPQKENSQPLQASHIDVVIELNRKRIQVRPLQQKFIVNSTDGTEKRTQKHGQNPDVRPKMPGFFSRSKAHGQISGKRKRDSEPFHPRRPLAHKSHRHRNRKNRSARPNRRRNAQRQAGNRIKCKRPAGSHNRRF